MLAILYALRKLAIDLLKSRSRLEAENLLLRHQLNVVFRIAAISDSCRPASQIRPNIIFGRNNSRPRQHPERCDNCLAPAVVSPLRACSRRSVGCSGRAPCFRSPIARVFVYVALWLGRRPSLGSFGALSVV